MPERPSATGQREDVNELLGRVHERLGLGLDIATWVDGTVEVRWKRDYGDDGWSDERFASAQGLAPALQAVLDHEDEGDAAEDAE